MKKCCFPILLMCLWILGCDTPPIQTLPTTQFDPVYKDFIGEDFEYLYIHRPAFAEDYTRYKGQFTNPAHHQKDALAARINTAIQSLAQVDTSSLDTLSRLHHQALGLFLENRQAHLDIYQQKFLFNPVDGIHLQVLYDMAYGFSLSEKRDSEPYLARLRAFPRQWDIVLGYAIKQAKDGKLPPKYMLEAVRTQMDSIIRTPIKKHILLRGMARQLGKVDPIVMNEYTALEIIKNTDRYIRQFVTPAYQKTLPYLDKWISEADNNWDTLSNETYSKQLSYYLGYTYNDIDDLWTDAQQAVDSLNRQFDLENLPRLRTEDQLLNEIRYQIPVMDSAGAYLRKMQRNSRGLFDSIPPSRPLLLEQPDIAGSYTPLWSYLPPALDGSRKGVAFMDMTHPEYGSLHKDEALFYAWTIPGTHFSTTVQHDLLKLGDWPRMIQYHGNQAGWRLLAEDLVVQELGLLSSDVEQLARYAQMKVLATAKIVVDQGLHTKGWTQEAAIAYLVQNASVSPRVAKRICTDILLHPGKHSSEWIAYLRLKSLQKKVQKLKGSDYLLQDFYQLMLNFQHFPLDFLSDSIIELI